MATAPTVDLPHAHRIAQAGLSAATFAAMAAVWPVLDPNSLDTTATAWVAAGAAVINRSRPASIDLAAAYLTRLRAEAAISGPPVLPAVPELPITQIAVALSVTGPIAVKAAVRRGVPLAEAMATAQARSSAAGARLALSGGRTLLTTAADVDPHIVGYRRTTSPGACAFCSRLARYSDQRVYGHRVNRSLWGEFLCHDNCHCQPKPVFR